jgi:copper chaperone CopZ
MLRYQIEIEDMLTKEDSVNVKQALETVGDTAASVNWKKHTAVVDTDERIEDLYQALLEAGYSLTDVELIG